MDQGSWQPTGQPIQGNRFEKQEKATDLKRTKMYRGRLESTAPPSSKMMAKQLQRLNVSRSDIGGSNKAWETERELRYSA